MPEAVGMPATLRDTSNNGDTMSGANRNKNIGNSEAQK
jgi:hypothetical protein